MILAVAKQQSEAWASAYKDLAAIEIAAKISAGGKASSSDLKIDGDKSGSFMRWQWLQRLWLKSQEKQAETQITGNEETSVPMLPLKALAGQISNGNLMKHR